MSKIKFVIPSGIVLVLIIVATLGMGISHADANNVTSLVVSPPTFDLSANPGDSLKESIRVDNITDKTLTISASLESFVPLGTTGAVNLTNKSNPYSLISWINLSPRSATIAKKSSQTFQFTINVPKNAEPGGKFGSIVFSTGAANATGSNISVSQRVGSLVLLRIAGHANEAANISNFTVNTGYKKTAHTIAFTPLIRNFGNVQVKPVGAITITDMFGNKIGNVAFDSKYILPGASRSFTELWHHGFLIGHYNANLTLLYGSSNKIMTASVGFVTIPWAFVSVVLFIVGLVGFLLWKGRRRISKALRILFAKDSRPKKNE